jgi:membrane protein DedA with SNARE-associated domain
MVDIILNVLLGSVVGLVIGFILGAWFRKKFDMKGWELADKYKNLYDELLNETVELQKNIQGEDYDS